ncbi:MAG: DNRLRE domain-containing protein, partial [Chloroflexi bacterium]|nr:DNRLRE domain-containing protein [Chloroflexota bacterium]
MKLSLPARLIAFTFILLMLIAGVAVFAGNTVLQASTAEIPTDAKAPQPGVYPLDDSRYLAIIPAGAMPADTYTTEPYIDTYVDSVATNSSFCTNTKLAVQYNGSEFGDELQRAFLGFHLSSIPSDAIIDSAFFRVYLYDAWGANPVNISLREVTAKWSCPLYWTGPKSLYFKAIAVSTTSGWKSWDITALVNKWKGKNFGVYPNYGFELRGPESGGSKYYYYRYFRSKNASTSKPYLIVTYHLPPTNTPTPTRTPTPKPTNTPTPTP